MARVSNSVTIVGRLVGEVTTRQANGAKGPFSVASFTVAVDRGGKRDESGKSEADFIRCQAMGGTADFIAKYFHKGDPLMAQGEIRTGSYQNKDGQTVYTTDVLVDRAEFVPRNTRNGNGGADTVAPTSTAPAATPSADGFINIPDGADEGLPWN